MVLGGVHGNELTGIRAVHRLRERFGVEKLARGMLTVAIGNPAAVARGTRGSAPHMDLNRSFRAELLAEPKTYEERRAAELAPFIAEADALLDLHAVNTPSEPFVVATAHDARRAELGAAFPCRTYVVAPDAIIPGSTDGWAGRCGRYGIGYESGHMRDLARLDEVKRGVDGVMRRLGLVGGPPETGERQAVIRIEEPIVLDGEAFAFASGRGKEGFEPFAKGDVLGHIDGRPVRAPFSGLLLFPKPKRLHRTGSPVGFLAVRA
jgi:predicted deacylase